jgi:hypothetical protein
MNEHARRIYRLLTATNPSPEICIQAAQLIRRQAAEIEHLRKALRHRDPGASEENGS